MPGVAVVDSGNYSLEIDTGFLVDAFTLDSATKGLLNSPDYVLDGTTEFAEVLDGINSLTCRRGRRDMGDQFGAGSLSFTMLDTTGVFNPLNSDSPFFDTANDQPGLAPMRRVRLSRFDAYNVQEYLFVGRVVNFDYNFQLGGLDTVTVFCADDFYLLSQTDLASFNVSEQLSSARLSAVLDRPEISFPVAQRDITTGTQTLGGAAAFTVSNGTNALAYCNQINVAEQGRLFMARDGYITFQPRIGNTLSAPVADFHDDGTNFRYNGVGISFEANEVVNRASVSILGGSPEVAEDLASQAVYFIQTESITNSLLHSDAAALDLAEYLLVPTPTARYTSVQTEFLMLTEAQRDLLATVDIGTTITVEKTFITSGNSTTELAQELAVEGIEHRIDVNRGHSVTYWTSPTTIVYELVLDDLIFGVIAPSDNVLG
jgi:hypothetical protein